MFIPLASLGDACAGGADASGFYVGRDMVYMPAGNPGLTITTTLAAGVPVDGGVEQVVDEDVYLGWGAEA
jgi:hypothetical protein